MTSPRKYRKKLRRADRREQVNERENRIATAVEFAKGEVWPMECFNDHYEFVNDCEYLLGRVRELEAR